MDTHSGTRFTQIVLEYWPLCECSALQKLIYADCHYNGTFRTTSMRRCCFHESLITLKCGSISRVGLCNGMVIVLAVLSLVVSPLSRVAVVEFNGSVKEPNKFHNYETEKITCKASDAAEYIELFGSSAQDGHARRK